MASQPPPFLPPWESRLASIGATRASEQPWMSPMAMVRTGTVGFLTPGTRIGHEHCKEVRTKPRFSRFRRNPIMDRPRLLVVDDDPYTRIAFNAFFTRGGWQVSLA